MADPDEAAVASDARTAALAWAAHVRQVRTALVADLADGRCDLAGALARRHEAAVATVHLLGVIEAVPDVRRIDARRALDHLGLAHDTPLGELDDTDVARLLAERSTMAGDATGPLR